MNWRSTSSSLASILEEVAENTQSTTASANLSGVFPIITFIHQLSLKYKSVNLVNAKNWAHVENFAAQPSFLPSFFLLSSIIQLIIST